MPEVKRIFLDYMPEGITLLPNTSGARDAKEAVRIARLARELGCGDFVKVEVIHDSKYLLPDNRETIKATEILAKEGFIVMPYMMPDLAAARAMADAGAAAIMPLGAPIGSNKGPSSPEILLKFLLKKLIFPLLLTLASDARPRHVRLWKSEQPLSWPTQPLPQQGMWPLWPGHLSLPLRRGRLAYLAGPGRVLEHKGEASSPLTGFFARLIHLCSSFVRPIPDSQIAAVTFLGGIHIEYSKNRPYDLYGRHGSH